jgi:hypothetical protein
MRVRTLQRHKTVDGVVHQAGEEYECDADLAARSAARGLVHVPEYSKEFNVDWWGMPGRLLDTLGDDAEAVFATERTPGAITILAGTTYDPGSSAFRLHTAINQCSPHASIFARYGNNNPHCDLRQLDILGDAALVRAAMELAAVVHCHMDWSLLELVGVQWKGVLVHHYHGSLGTTRNEKALVDNARDEELDALQVGARLYHLQFSDRMEWLPIAIPVDRYARLAAATKRSEKVFRVAHSPTVRRLKGTEVFLEVCSQLRAKGIPVEPVLIENMSHHDALVAKAACDATFDSFWLGIQGSGLEGAAMGQPVIAGDFDACAAYVQHVGACPYTFANDADSLSEMLSVLAQDTVFREEEAARVGAYAREYHDYPAVARRYSEILQARIPEIAVPDVPTREPLITHEPPPAKTPTPEPKTTPTKPPKRTPRRKPPETR